MRHIDETPQDKEFLRQFNEDVYSLAGCVIEMLETTPSLVLSPVLRKLVLDKAKDVQAQHGPLKMHLCVDNPGDPLTKWKESA